MQRWVEGECCADAAWEVAYQRFETPEQETQKFLRRLRASGAHRWPKDARVVELFCGRGNGLVALARLGFARLEGVDLSPSLLARYAGPATLYVGDCRALYFEAASKDAVVIQGGLHHLEALPDDLERVLCEVRRVLTPQGRLLAVEPWPTPFLSVVHAACGVPALRGAYGKLDALATMIERERDTYERWLSRPRVIEECFARHFVTEHKTIAWGKRVFVGRPR